MCLSRSIGTGKEGKEVCDLLVVCGRHVVIFSDKHCRFQEGGNIELSWSRWFRKTVERSADQVWGAERWIRNFPSRLFLDRSCTKRFPIDLPAPNDAIFHRIVVAHGVSEPFKRLGGGSGSLMVMSDLIGDRHYTNPFAIGWLGEHVQGYVHVFDDTSLDIVLKTLDTITDFVSYLERKENLLSNTAVAAGGEEELLAHYLGHLNSEGHHDFVFPAKYDAISIAEGLWQRFLASPQRAAQLKADEISYFWDELIEKFSHHAMQGTQYWASSPGVGDVEKILRIMAKEPRTRRRMLSKAILERAANIPSGYRATRIMFPSYKGDPYYVFLALPWDSNIPEEQYRRVRRRLLENYCMVLKLDRKDAEQIVGIATEAGSTSRYRSEDALYFDATKWTTEEEAEARKVKEHFGLLKDVTMHHRTEQEYPSPIRSSQLGPSRNSPCPCGSGKRYKRCCGK